MQLDSIHFKSYYILQSSEISLRERRGTLNPVYRRLWSCYDFCWFLTSIVNQEINKNDLMKKKLEAKKGEISAVTLPLTAISFLNPYETESYI